MRGKHDTSANNVEEVMNVGDGVMNVRGEGLTMGRTTTDPWNEIPRQDLGSRTLSL